MEISNNAVSGRIPQLIEESHEIIMNPLAVRKGQVVELASCCVVRADTQIHAHPFLFFHGSMIIIRPSFRISAFLIYAFVAYEHSHAR